MNVEQARAKLTAIMRDDAGEISFSGHARLRMAERGITEIDVLAVLENGDIVPPPQRYERSFRFRVQDLELVVIFTFDGDLEAAVVTVWRQ